MGLHLELQLEGHGKQTFLPPACHTLSKLEKISFCDSLGGTKVPLGYSSGIGNFVSMEDLKFVCLKSHDCRVLIQQLLLVAICGILPKSVRYVITRLCMFFNSIFHKVIEPTTLDDLENEAIIILCQLEMYFPSSFLTSRSI